MPTERIDIHNICCCICKCIYILTTVDSAYQIDEIHLPSALYDDLPTEKSYREEDHQQNDTQ